VPVEVDGALIGAIGAGEMQAAAVEAQGEPDADLRCRGHVGAEGLDEEAEGTAQLLAVGRDREGQRWLLDQGIRE